MIWLNDLKTSLDRNRLIKVVIARYLATQRTNLYRPLPIFGHRGAPGFGKMSLVADQQITVTKLPSPYPEAQEKPSHHVGSPPTSFCNPWDSATSKVSISDVFSAKFFRTADKTNVPVPANREGLVPIRKPEWGASHPNRLKATWIGHASWLIETATSPGSLRGVRILLDPVFSERTSPVQWFGPKRYSPTPCTIEELPEIDVITISHNHYDHLDSWTIKEVWRITKSQNRRLIIMCGLGNKAFFTNMLPDLTTDEIFELDWWDAVSMSLPSLGNVEMMCTPAQHTSARSVNDKDKTLWCSWIIRELDVVGPKTLFFAGDTGYRHVNSNHPTPEEEATMPRCPAFKSIGEKCGPFDLALLPIGLYSPRDFMSTVHCSPEDSVCIHQDIRSKYSVGMHYGTVRGGLSAAYEDVLEPPRRWKSECEKAGLRWGEEVGLCDIGETVLI